MSNWYVLQVLSGHEKKAKKHIEEQAAVRGIAQHLEEVLLPTENVSEVRGGEQKVVEKKLWPGYLLIKMDMNDDSWQYVRHSPSVIGFLGGDQPTSLTEHEVGEILEDLKSKEGTVTQRHQFQIGDSVKIVEGVFVNFVGTVTEVYYEKGKLSVLVSIFGRDTRVDDLDFTQVEEATDGN